MQGDPDEIKFLTKFTKYYYHINKVVKYCKIDFEDGNLEQLIVSDIKFRLLTEIKN